MANKIQLRRDSAANWSTTNPVLSQGEIGIDLTNNKIKIGNGTTAWNTLAYFDDRETVLSDYAGNIVPSIDDTYTLGTPEKRWRDLFVTEGSIYIGDIKLSNVDGKLVINRVTDGGTESEDIVEGGTDAVQIDLTEYALKSEIPDVSNFITIEDIPAIPADISDLTDTQGLLGQGGGSSISNGFTSVSVPNENGDVVIDLDDNNSVFSFKVDGTLELPAGGTITEGVVTDNPTIELTPANPDAASQKLVIKGGGPTYSNTENNITVSTYALTVAQGDTAYFSVSAPLYAGETFYWWVDNYSPGSQFSPDNGTVTLDEFGYGEINFTVNDDTVTLIIFVADTLYNAYINNKGAASVTVNEGSGETPDLYHLHLTTGDLQETSVFLGTDNHNIRTKIDGSVELTSYDYDDEEIYRLTLKNNVLKISSTINEGDEDLYIKSEDDLYLDALGDDIHIRADDDIRLRPGFDFEEDTPGYEWRFTDGGTLIFYNGNEGNDYGYIRMYDDGVGGPRTIGLEGNQDVAITADNGSHTWTFDTSGDLTLPNQSGKINSSVSDGGGLQVEAELDFEIKVNDGEGGSNIWSFAGSDITFPDGNIQTTAYAGGVGHMMMIDTNRTDSYTEVGSADRPFKTFAAAIAAAEAKDATAFTFVLMGCTVTEDVDFSNTTFTAISIAATDRAIFTGNITIASISTLSQMAIRNIEVGGTFTITGDGTANQMNNVSIYNSSFSGIVNITATNATAFYQAAFLGAVNFTNLSYLYINGAQFTSNWTITVDDTGTYPIPSRGITPGTGGSIAIVYSTIANNLIFVKGGSAAYIFQPHMTRIGLNAGTYTIPTGWTVTPHGSTLRGTWTNNGTLQFRNTSHDNAIAGTAPTYVGSIGAASVRFQDGTSQTTAFSLSPTLNVLKIDDGVHEKYQTKIDATGTVTHDCSSGHIFYHVSPNANWTVNLTNLNLAPGYVTTVSIIIEQEGTGYYPNALQIEGSAQGSISIRWQGNTNPTPSINRVDVVSFSIINDSNLYTVLGQLVGF
jgi:hypothetical protein